MSVSRLGVGLIGCGAATQAIHVPTLARLRNTFFVAHAFDVDARAARTVGERTGASHGTEIQALWENPDVDVVAICSPHFLHAAQVTAACDRGMRAVLCEKPLAVDLEEARQIAAVSCDTGVPVITGAMHSFDPAYTAAAAAWGDEPAALVRSVCLLPPNPGYEALATQARTTARPAPSGPQSTTAARLRDAVLGLASHHLPLVRRFMPQLEDVVEARPIEPWGYAITLVGGGTLAQMVGTVSISPTPHWTFRATSPTQDLHVAFPPPYVQAGSATAALAGDPARTWHHRTNGYVAEWKLLARLAREGDDGSRVREAVADFEWGTRIVEAARCSS